MAEDSARGRHGRLLPWTVVVTGTALLATWWLAGSVVPALLVDRWDCDLGWRCLGEPDALPVLLLLAGLLTLADLVPWAVVVVAVVVGLAALVRRRLPRTSATLSIAPAALAVVVTVALVVAWLALITA